MTQRKDIIPAGGAIFTNDDELAIFEEEIALRQQVAANYARLFSSLQGAEGDAAIQPPYIEPHNTSVYAQYTIRVRDREALQSKLKTTGIPTAVHYPILLNKQPAVADAKISLPVGDAVAQQVISLPMGPYLSAHSVQLTVQSLLAV